MRQHVSDRMLIVGLDLAGVETRPTGFCVLDKLKVRTSLLFTDDQIINEIETAHPGVVAIDAPLTLPEGRKSIEEKSNIHLRKCDRELLRRRIRFFPVTLGPMRKLTARGIRLREILESKLYRVIEVYPGGAQDVLGIPRKQKGLNELGCGLKKLKIKGISNSMTGDELDAITCAYVGKLYLEGKAVIYGTVFQAMVMPSS